MTDQEDDADDDDLTPEERANVEHRNRLAERYPTFVLLTKAMQRHQRLRRLRELRVPEQIIENAVEMRDKAFDILGAAFPYDTEINVYHLEDVLNTVRAELQRPHGRGRLDA
jgi:hypothetical protein